VNIDWPLVDGKPPQLSGKDDEGQALEWAMCPKF